VPPSEGCPFCRRVAEAGDPPALAFDDGFPVTPGHRLVVPRRHVVRPEDLASEEWAALFEVVLGEMRAAANLEGVAGVNVGINSGAAAGQTIEHAHVHVIPRRAGDVADPRGGVRWVIPARAPYWSRRRDRAAGAG
jgi:diadenosine tetraphosphate (Ap4A) HIT family hydrolase